MYVIVELVKVHAPFRGHIVTLRIELYVYNLIINAALGRKARAATSKLVFQYFLGFSIEKNS